MNTYKPLLITLLVVQSLLAVGLLARSSSVESSKNSPKRALNIDKSSLAKLELSSKESSARLVKVDGVWRLPDLKSLPADSLKVEALLDSLTGLEVGWPTSKDAGSHERYKVGSEDYQTKLTLTNADGAETVYFLGESPGFRKVYYRQQNSDDVYLVQLNALDTVPNSKSWLDRGLWKLEKVDSIKTSTLDLIKSEGQWALAGTEAPQLDQAKAQSVANAWQSLRVLDLSDQKIGPERTEIEVGSGETKHNYHLHKSGDQYLIGREDSENVFTLAKPHFEALTQVKLEELKSAEQPKPEPSASSTPQEASR